MKTVLCPHLIPRDLSYSPNPAIESSFHLSHETAVGGMEWLWPLLLPVLCVVPSLLIPDTE